MKTRYLYSQVKSDLKEKMLFLGGPRQVGKTTLAKRILGRKSGYLNWDISADREKILKETLPDSNLWVFDEIHKYRRWRNFLKGLYDSKLKSQQILVTGSARLDLYRFGGDSLQGRYHYLRLHPLSLAELGGNSQSDCEALFHLGGFPEPFFKSDSIKAKRWSREYRNRLLEEDISKLEQLQDLGSLEQLIIRLPDLVGSPLSINGLCEDLQFSHKTISKWLATLERVYAIFRIAPFGSPQIKARKKSQKHYHFDWTLINDEGARHENFVASHLLKWVHYRQDVYGEDLELRYLRDLQGREVDFVVEERKKPLMLVECKLSDSSFDKNLLYFHAKYPAAKAFQVVLRNAKAARSPGGARIIPTCEFIKDFV